MYRRFVAISRNRLESRKWEAVFAMHTAQFWKEIAELRHDPRCSGKEFSGSKHHQCCCNHKGLENWRPASRSQLFAREDSSQESSKPLWEVNKTRWHQLSRPFGNYHWETLLQKQMTVLHPFHISPAEVTVSTLFYVLFFGSSSTNFSLRAGGMWVNTSLCWVRNKSIFFIRSELVLPNCYWVFRKELHKNASWRMRQSLMKSI